MPGSVEYDARKENVHRCGRRRKYVGNGGCVSLCLAAHFRRRVVCGGHQLLGTGGNAHRKGVLIIRQNLDADSAYADAALHGDGLTSLQYREVKGGPTREIQSNVKGPRRLRIEKRGDYVWMSIARGRRAAAIGGRLVPHQV